MAFSSEDLEDLTKVVVRAWRSGVDRDWSAAAGTLEWSCTQTAEHTVDTVLAPAIFLASRNQDDYPPFDPFTLGADPGVETLVEGLEAAARVLGAVVATAAPDARAVIWRRPRVEVRGPSDFLPRGGLELILHSHDVCSGLRVDFDPPTGLCKRLREHTRVALLELAGLDVPVNDGRPLGRPCRELRAGPDNGSDRGG